MHQYKSFFNHISGSGSNTFAFFARSGGGGGHKLFIRNASFTFYE
jgi:hypothetical protein